MLVSPNSSDLMQPNIEFKTFPDGDSYVRIKELAACRGKDVSLFHRLYPEQNTSIFQAILLLDTLKKAGARTTLVSPYLPYSRQDKLFLEGEALSAEVLCSLFAKAGATKLVTLDCHFLKREGEFVYGGLKIKNISAGKALVEHAKSNLGTGNGKLEVISPDEGANYLVSEFGGKSMKKVRGEYEKSGEKNIKNKKSEKNVAYRVIEKMERSFEVKGKNILIIDDMISTGSTMIKAVENVRKGGAKKVLCAATHGFFLKDSLAKLRSISDGVFTTNSIPNPAAEVDARALLNQFME